jgi:hypothetical protein
MRNLKKPDNKEEKVDIVDLIRKIGKPRNPEDKEKFPKEAVLYMYRPETKYQCSECVFAKEGATKCAVFGPTEIIKPEGGCGFYLHQEPESKTAQSIPYLNLATKIEAGYEENRQGFTCGRCEYFSNKKQDCKKVRKDSIGDTPGIIDPGACCNRWDKDKERGDMTDKQLDKFFTQ